jgi:hypothetical protein
VEYREKFKLDITRSAEEPDDDEKQTVSDKENKTNEDGVFDSDWHDADSRHESDNRDLNELDINSEEKDFDDLSFTLSTVDDVAVAPLAQKDIGQSVQIEDVNEVEVKVTENSSDWDDKSVTGLDLDNPIIQVGGEHEDVAKSKIIDVGKGADENFDLEKTRPHVMTFHKQDDDIESAESRISHDDLMDLQKYFPTGDDVDEPQR